MNFTNTSSRLTVLVLGLVAVHGCEQPANDEAGDEAVVLGICEQTEMCVVEECYAEAIRAEQCRDDGFCWSDPAHPSHGDLAAWVECLDSCWMCDPNEAPCDAVYATQELGACAVDGTSQFCQMQAAECRELSGE